MILISISLVLKDLSRINPVNARLGEYLLKISWRHLSSLSPEDILNTFSRLCDQNEYIHLGHWKKAFSRRLEDILIKTEIFTLNIRPQNVFNTFWRRLHNFLQHCLQEIFKTSSMPRHLQNVFKTSCKGAFKTSLRGVCKMCLWNPQEVFKMCDQLKLFFLTRLEYAFKTFSRLIQHIFERCCDDDYLQKGLPRPHVWEIYDQGTNFPRVNDLDIQKLLE